MIEPFQINGFQRECYVYHTLMKSYQRIRREKELQELKIPRVLFSNETDGVLIMENLKAKGLSHKPLSLEATGKIFNLIFVFSC